MGVGAAYVVMRFVVIGVVVVMFRVYYNFDLGFFVFWMQHA